MNMWRSWAGIVLLGVASAAAQAPEVDVEVKDLAPPPRVEAPAPIQPLAPALPDPTPAAGALDLPLALPELPAPPAVPVETVLTEGTIVRLPPSAFPDLPKPIQQFLEQRGITIPQCFQQREPHNVLQGYFHDVSRPDWVVLGSLGGRSSILVFRRGSTDDVAELATSPDNEWLQDIHGDGVQGYSRLLDSASPERIREYHKTFGGPAPPELSHDGINDYFVEKSSTVWYWHADEWHKLQGIS